MAVLGGYRKESKMKKKHTRFDLQKMKANGEKVVWVTAYDFATAQFAEKAGMDMLLVGDSLGMCVYGYQGTVPVTMDQCICHSEAVPPEVCKIIRDRLRIPVYSIGAGVEADGQLMICSDVLGIFQAFTPKFVKRYAELGDQIAQVFREYADDVRSRRFPEEVHTYKMVDGELDKLNEQLQNQG